MPTTGALFVTNPRRRRRNRKSQQLSLFDSVQRNSRPRRRRNYWKEDREKVSSDPDVWRAPLHQKAFKESAYGAKTIKWLSSADRSYYTSEGKAEAKLSQGLHNLLPPPEGSKAQRKPRGVISKAQLKNLAKKLAGKPAQLKNAIALLKKAGDKRGKTASDVKKQIKNVLKNIETLTKPKKRTRGGLKKKNNSKESRMLAFSNPRRRRRKNLRKRRRRNGLALVRKNAIKLNRRRRKRKNTSSYHKKLANAMKKTNSLKAAHRLARKNSSTKRRRNAIKLNRKRRRNAPKRRRRNAIKLNRSAGRYNPRRRRNSVSKYRRRRNQAKPFVGMALGAVEDVQKKVESFPVVNFVAWTITPLVVGAGIYYLQKAVEPVLLPALKPLAKVPFLGEALKYPYTTTGLVLGIGLNLLAATKMGRKIISQKQAGMVGGLSVSMGVGLDLSLRSFAQAATQLAQTEAPLLAAQDVLEAEDEASIDEAIAFDEMDAVAAGMESDMALEAAAATNNDLSGYGDGGFYVIGADSQNLGALASQYGAIHSEYGDAKSSDAFICTPVMHPSEVSAAMAGVPFWRKKHGRPAKRLRGPRTRYSRHAGKMGHRYGWLIKMIGWKNFQKIAAQPAAKRKAIIQSFRKKALSSVPHEKVAIAQEAQLAETASMPVQGAANGASGFSGAGGYGALMFAGGGY
jgi:hypothetical protein